MYTDLNFQLPGLAPDHFRFLATTLDPSVSLALGYDWLLARNPNIDWIAGRLVARSNTKVVLPPATVAAVARLSDPIPSLSPVMDFPTSSPSPSHPSTLPDIEVIDAEAFARLAYDSPILVGAVTPRQEDESASSAKSDASASLQPPEDLSHIPACYHDFADVFSKAEADILPPHRSYDHTIDLEPETTAPFGPIYRLSEIELKAL